MMAQSAGARVSALIAEITIATETVTANCWNSWPEMPGMKATGTKTDSSTSVIARIAPVISPIAALAALAGDMPGFAAILASTASTTTMASSTTMPIASTIASSDTVLMVKPIANITAKVPTSATGTAISGMIVARRLPRKMNTTSTTSTKASIRVCSTDLMLSFTKTELSATISYSIPVGKAAESRASVDFTPSAAAREFAPGAR